MCGCCSDAIPAEYAFRVGELRPSLYEKTALADEFLAVLHGDEPWIQRLAAQRRLPFGCKRHEVLVLLRFVRRPPRRRALGQELLEAGVVPFLVVTAECGRGRGVVVLVVVEAGVLFFLVVEILHLLVFAHRLDSAPRPAAHRWFNPTGAARPGDTYSDARQKERPDRP